MTQRPRSMNVGIVGVTGAVGSEMLRVLERRQFPVAQLRGFASARSLGKSFAFSGRLHPVEILDSTNLDELDLVFFDASDAVSQEWVPRILETGAWVVDNSASFRLDANVPLVIPEVNGSLITPALPRRLIAGPNCSTVQLAVPLHAISSRWGLKRVVVTTLQSVSGAGTVAIDELRAQTKAVVETSSYKELTPRAFAHPIAFNCIPQIGKIDDGGNSSEELKIMRETQKILGRPDLALSATAVRVPTFRGHAESVNVELLAPATTEEILKAWADCPGLVYLNEPEKLRFAMNIDAAGDDRVFLSRLRVDSSIVHGFNFWIVADNLLKGAATNAVQIGETIAALQNL